jgi:hypothetical protein
MMLFLRALVILGAVLAVVSCRNAFGATLPSDMGGGAFLGGASDASCLTLTYSWETVPAAGGTISDSGTGFCL